MTTSSRASIADWLIQIPSAIDRQSPPSSPPSTSPSTAYSQSKANRKRKRQADSTRSESGSNDYKARAEDYLHRRALAEIKAKMSNRQISVI